MLPPCGTQVTYVGKQAVAGCPGGGVGKAWAARPAAVAAVGIWTGVGFIFLLFLQPAGFE